MSNVIKPKHGSSPPTVNNLEEYELGYYGGALYIRENGTIIQISGGGGGGGGSASDAYVDREELENMLDGVING